MGILLGWRLSHLLGRLSKMTAGTKSSSAPTSQSPNSPTSQSLNSPTPQLPNSPPTNEPLQLAYEMAHHMGQYKAGFLARTSHELRSPLNRVMSLQQLILADLCDNPEEEREFTRQSYEAAQELLKLLDQTTAISKLEHGTAMFSPESVSLMAILSELEMHTSLHAKNRNLRLSIAQPDTDVSVLIDPRWLRQVLINLVTTPIYMMDSGHIDVTHQINSAANTLIITVTDERPVAGWSESVNLLKSNSNGQSSDDGKEHNASIDQKAAVQAEQPSSAWGLSLITTTSLVEAMSGELKILSTPTSSEEGKTSIQCTIPLA
ncbi:MAG: sensor histidine kinase [Cyanobacteria bacterium P01_F01_bin.150]